MHTIKWYLSSKPILCSLVYLRKQKCKDLRFLFFSYSFTVRYRWKILLFAVSAPFLPHYPVFQKIHCKPGKSHPHPGSITASVSQKEQLCLQCPGIFFQLKKTKLDAVRCFCFFFVFIRFDFLCIDGFAKYRRAIACATSSKFSSKIRLSSPLLINPASTSTAGILVREGRQVPVFL